MSCVKIFVSSSDTRGSTKSPLSSIVKWPLFSFFCLDSSYDWYWDPSDWQPGWCSWWSFRVQDFPWPSYQGYQALWTTCSPTNFAWNSAIWPCYCPGKQAMILTFFRLFFSMLLLDCCLIVLSLPIFFLFLFGLHRLCSMELDLLVCSSQLDWLEAWQWDQLLAPWVALIRILWVVFCV